MANREIRVPIMLTVDEAKAIDDWRFANRVGSRSAAIRRLCVIAMDLPDEDDNPFDPDSAEGRAWDNGDRSFIA